MPGSRARRRGRRSTSRLVVHGTSVAPGFLGGGALIGRTIGAQSSERPHRGRESGRILLHNPADEARTCEARSRPTSDSRSRSASNHESVAEHGEAWHLSPAAVHNCSVPARMASTS
jgi:hypothetical protein